MSYYEIVKEIDSLRTTVKATVRIDFTESCTTQERETLETCLNNLMKFLKHKGFEAKKKERKCPLPKDTE